jgi:hypothetical protein
MPCPICRDTEWICEDQHQRLDCSWGALRSRAAAISRRACLTDLNCPLTATFQRFAAEVYFLGLTKAHQQGGAESVMPLSKLDLSDYVVVSTAVSSAVGEQRLHVRVTGMPDELIAMLQNALDSGLRPIIRYSGAKVYLRVTEVDRESDGSVVVIGIQL